MRLPAAFLALLLPCPALVIHALPSGPPDLLAAPTGSVDLPEPSCDDCTATPSVESTDTVVECAACDLDQQLANASLSVTYLGLPIAGKCEYAHDESPPCEPSSDCEQRFQIDLIITENSCFHGKGVWVESPVSPTRDYKSGSWSTTYTQQAECRGAGPNVDPGTSLSSVKVFCAATGGVTVAHRDFKLTCSPCDLAPE